MQAILASLSWALDITMSGHGCNQLSSLIRQCCVHECSQARSWRSFSSAVAGSSSWWAILASRGVLQAEGSQALDFLQGVVSNDVRPLFGAGPQQPPVYATILTPKGKFLHDVFLHPHPEQPDAVLIDVDYSGRAAALQLLNRYKLRRPIKVQDVSSAYCVAAAWGSSSPPPGPWWRPDPRLPELGFRGLTPASAAAAAAAVGDAAPGNEDDYRLLRYRLGVAEGETEIPTGQTSPLDFNVDVLNGVSYTKGCYVGQERNSFTHYRGVIRRRLMPVRLEAPAPGAPTGALQADSRGPSSAAAAAAATSAEAQSASSPPVSAVALPISAGADVVDAASGRSVGQLRGAMLQRVAGDGESWDDGAAWGIAYLKLDAALSAAEGKSELVVAASAPSAGPCGRILEPAVAGRGREGAAAVAAAISRAGLGKGAEVRGEGVATGIAWRLVPVRPAWWPAEWGREEEQAGARERAL